MCTPHKRLRIGRFLVYNIVITALWALACTAAAQTAVPEPPDAYQTRPKPSRPVLDADLLLRLDALDGHLHALGSRGANYIVDGVLSGVLGATSITLGVFLDTEPELKRYLYIFGTLGLLRGGLTLWLTPDVQELSLTYAQTPARSPAQVQHKVLLGEATLAEVAHRMRILRLTDASLNLAAGLAFIPIYASPNGFDFADPITIFAVIGAGLSVVTAVIGYVVKSNAERRQAAYAALKTRLAHEAQGPPRLPERTQRRVESSAQAATMAWRFRF